MDNYFIVLKIFSEPRFTLSEVEQAEFKRLYTGNDSPVSCYQAKNPALSQISYVYTCIFRHDEDRTLHPVKGGEKIHLLSEFFDYLEKIQKKNDTRICWVGYNLLNFDLPKLNLEIMKSGKDLKLFDTTKFKKFPVFDIMSWVYCWGINQSLFLTAQNFGIEVNPELVSENFLENLYNEEVGKNKVKYLEETGRYICQIFHKIYKYYVS